MENDFKKLEEIQKELISLQSKVEIEGDVNGDKMEKLESLMEQFDSIINNLKINKNENE